jgi:carboxylesterase type B
MHLPSLIAIVATFILPSYCGPLEDDLTVSTKHGRVRGTLVSNTVRQYLGIPYATAQRWSAPLEPPTWSNTFDALHFGDSCFQAPDADVAFAFDRLNLGAGNITESEECLSVNVWAPAKGRKMQTAVMIWIHGGGLDWGTVRYFN